MISVLVRTLNEDNNLSKCLESVRWADDVVVVDSFSTDRTVEIAQNFGARVYQKQFDNEADQQNWINENIPFRHEWVYYSDADEVVTSELAAEMVSVVSDPSNPHSAFRLRYRNFFLGRWIKHCGIYPVWVLRLFRPEKVRWERAINTFPNVKGSVGFLSNHFNHYSFNNGFNAWFDRHNKYSWYEAIESLNSLSVADLDWRDIFARNDPAKRRLALKKLSFRLPGRPLLRFIYMFFFKRGFLDGRPGLIYCLLISFYELMIVLKIEELSMKEKGLRL